MRGEKVNNYIEQAEHFLNSCVFDGLAHSYDVNNGMWVKPYPEVTGYLLNYFFSNKENLSENILMAADNLTSIQHDTGGYSSFFDKDYLYAFDTAQILVGLVAAYKRLGKEIYKEKALKASEFLLKSQCSNGAIIPIYNTKNKEFVIDCNTYKLWGGPWSGLMAKLSEAFTSLFSITSDDAFLDAKQLIRQFYRNSSYIHHSHPLGYWMEGMYDCGEYELLKKVVDDKVLPRLENNGFIAYTEDLDFAYVSGNAQLAIILKKLGYEYEAKTIRDYIRNVQSNHDSGGIFQYANKDGTLNSSIHTEINSWGTKYFCELERICEE